MPDRDGRWTTAELDRFKLWRDAKFERGLTCSACDQQDFMISPTCLVRVGVTTIDGASAINPGRGHPEIVLVCSNCGLSLGFSAQRTGMV